MYICKYRWTNEVSLEQLASLTHLRYNATHSNCRTGSGLQIRFASHAISCWTALRSLLTHINAAKQINRQRGKIIIIINAKVLPVLSAATYRCFRASPLPCLHYQLLAASADWGSMASKPSHLDTFRFGLRTNQEVASSRTAAKRMVFGYSKSQLQNAKRTENRSQKSVCIYSSINICIYIYIYTSSYINSHTEENAILLFYDK